MHTHEENVTVRFEDADPAGLVFYPRAVAMAHALIEELIARSPLGWAGWFASPSYAAPVRKVDAEFLRPMRAGETFRARAEVERIGSTSVTFVVELGNADAPAARIRSVHVLIDKVTGRPVPVPGAVREALKWENTETLKF